MTTKSINKIGVLGAGLMGHGIAYVSASSGFEVVLVDTSDEQLKKAKNSRTLSSLKFKYSLSIGFWFLVDLIVGLL